MTAFTTEFQSKSLIAQVTEGHMDVVWLGLPGLEVAGSPGDARRPGVLLLAAQKPFLLSPNRNGFSCYTSTCCMVDGAKRFHRLPLSQGVSV